MKQRPRVLIIDDRVIVRETVIDILSIFDCDFSEADNAASALEEMGRCDPDVIFLDLMLQDEADGLDVLLQARRRGLARGKVIVLTGRPEIIPDQLQVFAYLTKTPIDMDQVRETFKGAIPHVRSAPTAVETSEAHTEVPNAMMKPRGATTRDQRPAILVLDDKQMWLETIEQILGSDFQLTLTASVEEAWKHARKRRFDLVVLDMKLLGGVSGLDVLERMRKAIPDLRAIMLTDRPDLPSAVESVRRGALDYVSKANVADLVETAKRALSRQSLPRVFLSYEKTDRPKVARLHERLARKGVLPWMDRKNIVGGRRWLPQIRKAIESVDFFVFCASPNSVTKRGVLQREVKWALEREQGVLVDDVFFIVLCLEPCDIPYFLVEFEYIKLYERDGFKRLLLTLATKPASVR